MTISLTVILIELTNEIEYGLPILLIVMVRIISYYIVTENGSSNIYC